MVRWASPLRFRPMRAVFVLYLVVITVGIAFYTVIGLVNP
jgi:hypothetical protein